MRVAQRMISRNYLKSLNNSLAKRAESFERGTSGLKFNKLSDNVSDGARAMHIQEERYQSTQQLSNVEDLLSELNSVDSNLDSIGSILQTIQEKVLQGMSENYGEDKRAILAREIASKKDQILQFANAQFGGKYLFGGTNNSSPPFSVNETSRKLEYNGVEVEKIFSENGAYYYMDGGDKKEVPNSGKLYADIGLGLKVGQGMQPDPRTAFQVSFSGPELMGFGPPATGKEGTQTPSNVYDLLTSIEQALTPDYDGTALNDLQRQLVKLTDGVGMVQTDLGTRMDFLDRTKTRLEDDIDNMGEMESKLISSEPSEEAIRLKECEYVWMAVLQLGNQILPSSLLDFMR